MATLASMQQQVIPQNWAQCTVVEKIQVPVDTYWEMFLKMKPEIVRNAGTYRDLPKIASAISEMGNFTLNGHRRRIHFANGKTQLETVIESDRPIEFAYEISQMELPLKKIVYRARSHFYHFAVSDKITQVSWTFGFDQKNLIFKWIALQHIKSTHIIWMRDTLSEMKRLAEKWYFTQHRKKRV